MQLAEQLPVQNFPHRFIGQNIHDFRKKSKTNKQTTFFRAVVVLKLRNLDGDH